MDIDICSESKKEEQEHEVDIVRDISQEHDHVVCSKLTRDVMIWSEVYNMMAGTSRLRYST